VPNSQPLYDQLRQDQEVTGAGQFIMSGSFTVLPALRSDSLALTEPVAPPAPTHGFGRPGMPGFHRNRQVRRRLRKLRRNFSRLQRLRGPEPGSARESTERLLLPQQVLYIR
jgi:hypothetical protein